MFVQVRILVHTDVTKYLEFKGVDGSYVLNKGRVEKVPATDYEALRSPLLGLFEKRRLRSFLLCVPSFPQHYMSPVYHMWPSQRQEEHLRVSAPAKRRVPSCPFPRAPAVLKGASHRLGICAFREDLISKIPVHS